MGETLARRDRRRLRDATASLNTISRLDVPALSWFLPALRELIGAEKCFAYRICEADAGWALDFMHVCDFAWPPHFVPEASSFLAGAPRNWAHYDALRPQPSQRNVVVAFDPVVARKLAVGREFYPRVGLSGRHQLRTLVCDGPVLLAWVGGFRREPFLSSEAATMAALVQPLQARLKLEAQLGAAELRRAELGAAMEAIPTAAFLVSAQGAIHHANTAGHLLADERPADVRARVRDTLNLTRQRESRSVTPDLPAFQAMRIEGGGIAPRYLLVLRGLDGDPTERVAAAQARWKLTPRETSVLSHLARGEANKTIAEKLRCAAVTIEVHVSAILRKARVDNRSALVAKFWTER